MELTLRRMRVMIEEGVEDSACEFRPTKRLLSWSMILTDELLEDRSAAATYLDRKLANMRETMLTGIKPPPIGGEQAEGPTE